jgi:D-alanyl-D-alanine carboxypeptidase
MVYRQVIVLIKRSILLLLVLEMCCSIAVFADAAPVVSAASAVLYDPLSETVLYEKNGDQKRGMASTTKIMTAIVALELYDLSEQVTIQPEWCGIEGSSIYLKPGEQMLVSDLLYGLLLASGNDAAVALAGLHQDGESGFLAAMNQKAAELGLLNTHFENPSGLDGETHYTTALELAKLASYAMKIPVFAEIVGTKSQTVAGRTLSNHNRLLREIGACGVKTGYTKACGRCLVSAKEQHGRMLICVTLNAPNDWADHTALYAYGFSQYNPYEILGAGDCGSCQLVSSEKDRSRLYCNESFSFWLTEAEKQNLKTILCGPRFCYGTVCAGTPYGSIQVRLGHTILFETPVYFADHSREIEPENGRFKRWMNFIIRRREP